MFFEENNLLFQLTRPRPAYFLPLTSPHLSLSLSLSLSRARALSLPRIALSSHCQGSKKGGKKKGGKKGSKKGSSKTPKVAGEPEEVLPPQRPLFVSLKCYRPPAIAPKGFVQHFFFEREQG